MPFFSFSCSHGGPVKFQMDDIKMCPTKSSVKYYLVGQWVYRLHSREIMHLLASVHLSTWACESYIVHPDTWNTVQHFCVCAGNRGVCGQPHTSSHQIMLEDRRTGSFRKLRPNRVVTAVCIPSVSHSGETWHCHVKDESNWKVRLIVMYKFTAINFPGSNVSRPGQCYLLCSGHSSKYDIITCTCKFTSPCGHPTYVDTPLLWTLFSGPVEFSLYSALSITKLVSLLWTPR